MYGSWEVFFSLQPYLPKTAENFISIYLYHKFIYPTISALVGSLCARDEDHEMKLTRLKTRELIYKVRWLLT